MDPFLRRVVAQRLREQEAALLARPAAAFRPPRCTVCDVSLQRLPEGSTRTMCRACERAAKKAKAAMKCSVCEGGTNMCLWCPR